MQELQTMIILIEAEYEPHQRNTPEKLITLISKEFNVDVSTNDILQFYGLSEDYEKISWQIEHGHNYY